VVGPGPGPVRFSTVGLPDGQRIAKWEAHNADALIGLRCRSLDERTLEATEINLQLPTLHLARVIGPSHVVERTTEVIRRAPADAIACYFSLVGEAFFYHDDGVRVLRPGQLVVCDADRPFVRGFSRGLEELVLKVPRETFREVTGISSLAEPRTVDFARGDAGDLRARTLARLVGAAVGGHGDGDGAVDDATLLGLLGALLGGEGRAGAVGGAHLAAARVYVEEHLAERGLGAARIAAGVGISERHLSRVFAAGGMTVPQYVLGRRLERARALLLGSGAGAGPLSVGEVAVACGFGSADRFSHAFRERYGVRASDVARQARASASTMSKRTRDQG